MSYSRFYRQKTHGMGGTRAYQSWFNMKSRCLDEYNERYRDYGGRGIKICAKWMKFENFFADMGHPPLGKTLERINNNGNYKPNNCIWSTPHEQARNRKNNVILTFRGETMCLKDWATKFGIGYVTLHKRYQAGWTTERLLTEVPQKRSYS